jgi:hypothetical protein
MKITEVQQPSDRTLFESIDRENNTGFLTEDLVRIVRENEANRWSQPMTAEELLESLSAGK